MKAILNIAVIFVFSLSAIYLLDNFGIVMLPFADSSSQIAALTLLLSILTGMIKSYMVDELP